MPSKNIIKTYQNNSYYHLYNRGVEKRIIFTDQKDHRVFLSYLKTYLTPPPPISVENVFPSRELKNYASQIHLLAYCLMPNHFHLLVKQNPAHAISDFMRSLATKFSMYFNRRHRRVGSLFQSRYKAVMVTTDAQLLHLTRYIHLNPATSRTSRTDLEVYPYSSYRNYLSIIHQSWVKPQEILAYFDQQNPSTDYAAFVKEADPQEPDPSLILD